MKGVDVAFVDGVDPTAIANAITEKTKIVWLEACTNPTIEILDISSTVARVKAKNPEAWVVVDNTFLTPWAVRPLSLGADVVMHSCTKYLNGHSDVILGVLLCNSGDIFGQLSSIQRYRGATPSPFDCYLVVRSLSTLELRMEQHMKSGLAVAKFLSTKQEVDGVKHPLLSSHQQNQIALTQHNGKHSGKSK